MADEDKIRIDWDDLDNTDLPPPPPPAAPGAPRQWGSVHGQAGGQAAPTALSSDSGGSLLLHSWFYLALAGGGGAFLGWAICEPGFIDDGSMRSSWGNVLLIPLMITLLSVALAIVESLVERSPKKAIVCGLVAVGLGLVLGFALNFVAGFLYGILQSLLIEGGVTDNTSPIVWISRGIAWGVFGIGGGLVYGIVGRSGKKCLYGIIGGVSGAVLGGLIFDPISIVMGGAIVSRMVGISLFGASTGLAIGLVESALKDRWLYVSAGPLAGKQFILYKQTTVLGSQQSNDIYLFKDPNIQPQHAVLEVSNNQIILAAAGPTTINGHPASRQALRDGDLIQIGRYTFTYKEKSK